MPLKSPPSGQFSRESSPWLRTQESTRTRPEISPGCSPTGRRHASESRGRLAADHRRISRALPGIVTAAAGRPRRDHRPRRRNSAGALRGAGETARSIRPGSSGTIAACPHRTLFSVGATGDRRTASSLRGVQTDDRHVRASTRQHLAATAVAVGRHPENDGQVGIGSRADCAPYWQTPRPLGQAAARY